MTSKTEIPRREVLIGLGALGIGAASLIALGPKLAQHTSESHINKTPSISELIKYNKVPINPPHPKLVKPIVNAAYAPYFIYESQVENFIRRTQLLGSNTLRVYMNNSFQKRDGSFNMTYLTRLGEFISDINTYSEGEMGVVVCLKDYYNLLYRDVVNGLYEAKPLNDPALDGTQTPEEIQQRQIDVFTHDKYIQHYIDQSSLIIDYLGNEHIPVTAWEIGNEPDRSDIAPYLDDWYSAVGPEIKKLDPQTPIISGLKNPLSVNPVTLFAAGVDHTSAHVYDNVLQNSVDTYVDNMIEYTNAGIQVPPVLLSEVGIHRNFYRIPVPKKIHDIQVANGLTKIFRSNMRIDTTTGDLIMPTYGFGLWQQDYGFESHDGFHVDPDIYPKTAKVMQEISEIYSFNS